MTFDGIPVGFTDLRTPVVLTLALIAAGVPRMPNAAALGYTVPPGYTEQRANDLIIFAPVAVDATPCIYGIAPDRPATANLDADAEAALVQTVVPGWRRLDDRHASMRGTSATGWAYSWYRAAFEGDLGGQRQAVNAMAMVLPAGPGRAHVVWGMGNIARCLLDDASFEQLFHSLRPNAWRSDGGQALTRALAGTWRYTSSGALQQLTFRTDGRFARDLGATARVGVSERTSTTATEGRFSLRDSEITLVPNHRPQDPDRYRVRVYDEFSAIGWTRTMALTDVSAKPPRVIQYYRVDDTAR